MDRGLAISRAKTGVPQVITKIPAEHPTVRDLHWIAGFLEGEGCFYSARDGRQIQVYASQKQREPLERLQRWLGGNIHEKPGEDAHQWAVYGPRARGLMMTVYGLLSPRRQGQVRAALGVA